MKHHLLPWQDVESVSNLGSQSFFPLPSISCHVEGLPSSLRKCSIRPSSQSFTPRKPLCPQLPLWLNVNLLLTPVPHPPHQMLRHFSLVVQRDQPHGPSRCCIMMASTDLPLSSNVSHHFNISSCRQILRFNRIECLKANQHLLTPQETQSPVRAESPVVIQVQWLRSQTVGTARSKASIHAGPCSCSWGGGETKQKSESKDSSALSGLLNSR